MNRIRNRLLHLLRQRLLQGLWHLAVARRVAHFARLLVAAGVVDGLLRSVLACWTLSSQPSWVEQETYIWELMLELGRGLFLDLAWDFGVGGVGDALAVFVLHFDEGWGVCFENG
jgi:hypothetical protein